MTNYDKTDGASNWAVLPNRRRDLNESRKLCSICQNEYHPRSSSEWFCTNCYHTWNDDIKKMTPWVRYCMTSENKRRRQEYAMSDFVYIEERDSITVVDK